MASVCLAQITSSHLKITQDVSPLLVPLHKYLTLEVIAKTVAITTMQAVTVEAVLKQHAPQLNSSLQLVSVKAVLHTQLHHQTNILVLILVVGKTNKSMLTEAVLLVGITKQ